MCESRKPSWPHRGYGCWRCGIPVMGLSPVMVTGNKRGWTSAAAFQRGALFASDNQLLRLVIKTPFRSALDHQSRTGRQGYRMCMHRLILRRAYCSARPSRRRRRPRVGGLLLRDASQRHQRVYARLVRAMRCDAPQHEADVHMRLPCAQYHFCCRGEASMPTPVTWPNSLASFARSASGNGGSSRDATLVRRCAGSPVPNSTTSTPGS